MNDIIYCCFLGSFLKMFGPIIKAQCEKYPDSKPILWICKDFKYYKPKIGTDLPNGQIKDLRKKFPKLVIIESENLSDIVKKYQVNAVVSVAFYFPLGQEEYLLLKNNNIKLCCLGYVGEELLYILNNGLEVLDKWDIVTTFSPFWVDLICQLLDDSRYEDRIREKLIPIGFVQLDQAQDFDSNKIRKKYGIPLDKKIIYLSTYPFFNTIIPYSYKYIDFAFRKGNQKICNIVSRLSQLISPQFAIEHIVNYRQILSSLRDVADINDLLIIAKSRQKHKDPGFVSLHADYLFYDESYYPFSTFELMHISDIYIGFQSASVIETLFLGKYSVTLLPIPRRLYDRGLGSFGDDMLYENYLWKIDGVSDYFKLYNSSGYERYLNFLHNINDIHFDNEQRRLSVEKILAHDDFNASDRFLNLIYEG